MIAVIKETFANWREDKASRLAAALAYYTVFSLSPLLVIVIAITGFVLGRRAAEGQIVGQIQNAVGATVANTIQTMIQNASNPRAGVIATVLGIVGLVFGASGVFNELQDGLNTVWNVMPRPDRGIRGTIRDRLWSFAMVVGIAFLLLLSMIASAVVSALGGRFAQLLPGMAFLPQLINLVVSFLVIAVLFAMVYKILPDVTLAWRDVWVGAAVSSLLFTAGKYGIGLYLAKTGAGSAYGAAGSLAVILLWVYYSAQILFLGAEFTQAYADHYGSRITPDRNAVSVHRQTAAPDAPR